MSQQRPSRHRARSINNSRLRTSETSATIRQVRSGLRINSGITGGRLSWRLAPRSSASLQGRHKGGLNEVRGCSIKSELDHFGFASFRMPLRRDLGLQPVRGMTDVDFERHAGRAPKKRGRQVAMYLAAPNCAKKSANKKSAHQIFAAVRCAAPQVVRQRVLTPVNPPRASRASAAKIRKPS